MRSYATVLLVACSLVSLAGCSGRGHRHWCPFGDRFRHQRCVERDRWDGCDDADWDDDDGCDCGCHGGHVAPQCGAPMPSFDSGCGCGGGMSMPSYYGGMPMSYDSFPQSSGCSSCGGGMMSTPMMSTPMMSPTFDQPIMMNSPVPTPAPTPTPAVAPAAEYYSPGSNSSATSTTVPPKY